MSASWIDQYAAALQEYLAGAGEAALQRAYELGRRALMDGVGVLDVVARHHEAVKRVLQAQLPENGDRTLDAAEVFASECLSSFEMTHRGFREANAALRRMNDRLEDEAKRIAHALHDEAGQLLTSVHLALDDVARDVSPARDRLRQVHGLLDQIEGQLRLLSHELRPTMLDDLGLPHALKFLAGGIAKRSGLVIEVEDGIEARLPPAVETALYRVAQEALTNIVRHAKAARVGVLLERVPGGVQCRVRDDGVGFDQTAIAARPGERGFGLAAMRERLDAVGGTLRIESVPGGGTNLVMCVPIREC